MTAENVAGLAPELRAPRRARASTPLASAGERFTSYDVDAFEVPGGREENWRFTPMRRLRGLHDGTAALRRLGDRRDRRRRRGRRRSSVGRDDPRLGEGGVPADRVAAAGVVGVRARHLVTLDGSPAPLVDHRDRARRGARRLRHLQIRTGPHAEATVVLDHARLRHAAPTTSRSCWPTARG